MSRYPPAADWNTLCAADTTEPGEPPIPICGTGNPAPPTKASYLIAADNAPLRALFGGYAHCGHMIDGNMSGKTQRWVHVVWGAGTLYARMHATRCTGGPFGTAQSASLVSDPFVPPAVPDSTITAPSEYLGAEAYLDTGAVWGLTKIVSTGTAKVAGPDPSRYIAITAAKVSTLSLVEVWRVAGFCFEPSEFVTDIETL